jgi:hypothetical protein
MFALRVSQVREPTATLATSVRHHRAKRFERSSETRFIDYVYAISLNCRKFRQTMMQKQAVVLKESYPQ